MFRAATMFALLYGCACSAGAGPTRFAHVQTRTLPSIAPLECRGFYIWQADVDHALLSMAGTGSGSAAFVHPDAQPVVISRPLAYVAFDKPGVIASFGNADARRIDDDALRAHTQAHQLECARQALVTIFTLFGDSVRVHLRGHSEGSLIALYLYEELLRERSELALRIASVILSAVPLEPLEDIFNTQLDVISEHDGGALRAAVQACDWPIMRDQVGLSCSYLDDAFARPSGREVFERLAAHAAPADFYVLQGVDDWNTPIEPVRALEHWSADVPLKLTFYYFDGGHSGSEAAHERNRKLFEEVTAP